jgi:hypothetical protein
VRDDLAEALGQLCRVVLADMDGATIRVELRRTGLRVFRLRVIVGDDDDVRAAEEFVVLGASLVDAARVRGRREAERDG